MNPGRKIIVFELFSVGGRPVFRRGVNGPKCPLLNQLEVFIVNTGFAVGPKATLDSTYGVVFFRKLVKF